MKSKRKRIAIIGHFADGKEFYDGQTVSTRLLGSVLRKSNSFRRICKIDTYNYRKNFFKVFVSFLFCLISCPYIIIMLSGDGMKFFSPMLYLSIKLFRKKVFHRVIGGELDTFLRRNPKCIKYMNKFEVNWVQSKKLVKKLNDIGIKNAEYLENFREINPIELPREQIKYNKPYRFCTFCRVSEAKGISLAIESIAKVNEVMGNGTAVLDIYGPIEDNYSKTFHELIERYSSCVKYKGSVNSKDAVNTLKNYFMHLFPTTWSGEGFPGTLIDCYNAGLPTIASSWAYNEELISENITGYLYDWQTPSQLTDKILFAIQNKDKIWRMKEQCLEEAEKYKSEVVTAKIVNRIISC